MDAELTQVAPAAEMDAETLSKHIQARHHEPFEEVALSTIAIPARDLPVWQAYHRREHRVHAEGLNHFHRGEGDVTQHEHQGEEP